MKHSFYLRANNSFCKFDYPGLYTPRLGAPSDACRPAAHACRRLPAAAHACPRLPTTAGSCRRLPPASYLVTRGYIHRGWGHLRTPAGQLPTPADACLQLPTPADACRQLPTPSASFLFGVGCEARGSGRAARWPEPRAATRRCATPEARASSRRRASAGADGGAGRWWRRGVVEARWRGVKRRGLPRRRRGNAMPCPQGAAATRWCWDGPHCIFLRGGPAARHHAGGTTRNHARTRRVKGHRRTHTLQATMPSAAC
eukprot:364238-Chlamydomonas_euryale.AAC.5